MIEILDAEMCPQGSDQWFAAHSGIPTCSEFAKVMAKTGPRGGTTGKEYVGRSKYMRMLVGEIVTEEPREREWFGNRHTERGTEREPEARALYAMRHNVEPFQVGFIRAGNCGGSPDSLIGEDGGIELKDVLPHIQIERLQAGTLPSEYRWQVLGYMLITGRAWWDFVSHSRGLPLFEYRVFRKDVTKELQELSDGIDRFCAERDQLVEWIKAMW